MELEINVLTYKRRRSGFKKVQDLSLAAGIKMIWRLYTTNSLWARWIHHHYVKGSPISQLQCTILDSGSWKFIVHCKVLALSYMKKAVGKGADTSLCYDAWLPNGSLLNL